LEDERGNRVERLGNNFSEGGAPRRTVAIFLLAASVVYKLLAIKFFALKSLPFLLFRLAHAADAIYPAAKCVIAKCNFSVFVIAFPILSSRTLNENF